MAVWTSNVPRSLASSTVRHERCVFWTGPVQCPRGTILSAGLRHYLATLYVHPVTLASRYCIWCEICPADRTVPVPLVCMVTFDNLVRSCNRPLVSSRLAREKERERGREEGRKGERERDKGSGHETRVDGTSGIIGSMVIGVFWAARRSWNWIIRHQEGFRPRLSR